MLLRTLLLTGVLLLASSTVAFSQDVKTSDAPVQDRASRDIISDIEKILAVQAGCWNDDDIEGFMSTYWKSEELTFSSGGKTRRGWQATLDGYKKRYPAGKMGALTFDHLETTLLGNRAALVLGQWHLRYEDKDDMDGNFSLVLRRFEQGWKIVHDHSSSIELVETDD